MSFTSDPTTTSSRIELLQEYMAAQVLDPEGVVCWSLDGCRRSALFDRAERPETCPHAAGALPSGALGVRGHLLSGGPGNTPTRAVSTTSAGQHAKLSQDVETERAFGGTRACLLLMSELPGEQKAGERLRQTALRDFGPAPESPAQEAATYKFTVSRDDVPVPDLLRYALELVGLKSYGPGEKVAWSVEFGFSGERCQLAYQKFGLRLYVVTTAPPGEAERTAGRVMKKLRSSVNTVEKLILDAAPNLLGQGHATVVNQHVSLRRAYDYFRERATNPAFIEDKSEQFTTPSGTGYSFTSGQIQMRVHAFHDMVAAITAYLSSLEHDLVLALAFSGFDSAQDDLTVVIGSRWGDKFERLFGKQGDAARYRQRLMEIIERWRNPYSHGGFEKGHGATICLHVPGVNAALPVGLTSVRDSPLFSFLPATESDITQVFKFFDEMDGWIEGQLPHAAAWIESSLAVRFDAHFRSEVEQAIGEGSFEDFLRYHEYQQDRIDNMDY